MICTSTGFVMGVSRCLRCCFMRDSYSLVRVGVYTLPFENRGLALGMGCPGMVMEIIDICVSPIVGDVHWAYHLGMR